MSEGATDKPVTQKFLLDFTNKIILPHVREIIKEENAKQLDEILTSNDKLSAKLDKIIAEQAAHRASHERLQKRIDYLEAVTKVLAEKEGLQFNPPEL